MSRLLCIRVCPFRPRPPFRYLFCLSPDSQHHISTLCTTDVAALLRASSSPSPSQRALRSGETLTICGYIQTVRKQKRVAFAAIGDGSTLQTVQAVLAPQLAEGLSTGVAVTVTGRWTPSPGQEQSHELQVDTVQILGENDAATYPIQKKYQTPEFLRSVPHLRSRLPFNSLLLRLRSRVIAQMTNYLVNRDFVQCHPPIITSSDCEGAGEVFTVTPAAPVIRGQQLSNPWSQSAQPIEPFFGSPRYLTVSSQLHLEALAQSVKKVWALSPTFRAEKSDTSRHLSEFYMLEAELAFVQDVQDVMEIVEDLLRAIATDLQSSTVGQELLAFRVQNQEQEGPSVSHSTIARRWQGLIDGPWPKITYDKAVSYLKEAVAHGKVEFEFAPSYEDGLQTEHERFLAEAVGQGGPVFVTDYPRNVKPFYMAPSTKPATEEHSASTVACFDLLVPDICELVGGSIREHRLPELLQSMDSHGLQQITGSETEGSEAALQWYLDLRRYGSVPHGGFGLGFDRLLAYLSGVSNIKDVVSFPRWHQRCDC